MRPRLSHIAVVIPARNEHELIRRCLESITVAVAAVSDQPVTVSVTVVADACTDETVAVAREFSGVHVIEINACNVGVARAVGVQHALRAANIAASDIWLANTDADSMVPPHWLVEQAALALRGVELVIGTVRPDFADLTTQQVEAWSATHPVGVANGHVHGANLGLRASLYLAAGGYPPLAEHEDVDLVARCAAHHPVTLATDSCEVITSGRPYGRTDGGYARYLRDTLFIPATPIERTLS
ncbi:MAG: glycosyltransferase [Microbacteriaceae bacterium]